MSNEYPIYAKLETISDLGAADKVGTLIQKLMLQAAFYIISIFPHIVFLVVSLRSFILSCNGNNNSTDIKYGVIFIFADNVQILQFLISIFEVGKRYE